MLVVFYLILSIFIIAAVHATYKTLSCSLSTPTERTVKITDMSSDSQKDSNSMIKELKDFLNTIDNETK